MALTVFEKSVRARVSNILNGTMPYYMSVCQRHRKLKWCPNKYFDISEIPVAMKKLSDEFGDDPNVEFEVVDVPCSFRGDFYYFPNIVVHILRN